MRVRELFEVTQESRERRLTVHVSAWIEEGQVIEEDREAIIPPTYEAADVRALMARTIEDTAFALNQREFGRAPARDALVALDARLFQIRAALNESSASREDVGTLRRRIEGILEQSNAEATEREKKDTEGL